MVSDWLLLPASWWCFSNSVLVSVQKGASGIWSLAIVVCYLLILNILTAKGFSTNKSRMWIADTLGLYPNICDMSHHSAVDFSGSHSSALSFSHWSFRKHLAVEVKTYIPLLCHHLARVACQRQSLSTVNLTWVSIQRSDGWALKELNWIKSCLPSTSGSCVSSYSNSWSSSWIKIIHL